MPVLRQAVAELSWLLGRGYADRSALKLVGDRYALAQRQRTAVMRCTCTDMARIDRQARQIQPEHVGGKSLWLDGYNILTSVEAALSGGVLLIGRDRCLRDMASMHGSYRKVIETPPAIDRIGRTLSALGVSEALWLLDQPVSNSGRLKGIVQERAEQHGWRFDVQIVPDPDRLLIETDEMIATADSVVLDRGGRWLNLAAQVVRESVPDARLVDLGAAAL